MFFLKLVRFNGYFFNSVGDLTMVLEVLAVSVPIFPSYSNLPPHAQYEYLLRPTLPHLENNFQIRELQ